MIINDHFYSRIYRLLYLCLSLINTLNMKKNLLFLSLLLSFLNVAFMQSAAGAHNGEAANIMQINHLTAEPGDIVTIEVEVLNDEEFVAFNLRIFLPDGFTYVDGTEQLFRRTNHQFSFDVNEDNRVSILAFSITNDAFTGNAGKVFSFDVVTANNEGYYDLLLTDAIIGSPAAIDILTDTVDGLVTLADPGITHQLSLADEPSGSGVLEGAGNYNFTDTITVSATPAEGWAFVTWTDVMGLVSEEASFDYTMPPHDVNLQANFKALENIMKIADVTTVAGEVVTINLEISNEQEFAGFGLDMLLPDGFDYIDGSEQLFRQTDHELSFLPDNNVLSIEASSANNEEFEDNEGVILSFDVQTPGSAGEFIFQILDPSIINAEGENIITGFENGTVSIRSEFELSLDVAPEDAGEVEGEGVFYNGEEVEITAIPATGWAFANWTDEDGDLFSEEIQYEFIMPEKDITLTANFEPKKHTLCLLAYPADAGETNGAGEYHVNEEVPVEAIPFTAWEFMNWTTEAGDVVTSLASFTYVMPAGAVTLTANFKKTDYTLALLANPEEGGAVSSDEYIYNYEDTVTVLAEPNEGWQFVSWEQDGEVIPDAEPEYIFTMPAANLTLTASFEKIDYTLTAVAEPQEAGTVTGTGIYNMGDTAQLYAAPHEGWEFINWTDDSGVVTEVAGFSYVMPAAHVTLTANFEPIDFILTLTPVPEDGGETIGAGVYNFGDEVEINAIPAHGWAFAEWTDEDGEEVADIASFVYTMPANDATLVANFELSMFILTFVVADMDTGELIEDAIIMLDGEAFPAGHYVFGDLVPGSYEYSISREGYLPREGIADIIDQDVTIEIDLELDDDDTSINNIVAPELAVFPNPASNILGIQSNIMILSLQLIDMHGQIVYHTAVDDKMHDIPVSSLLNGFYILQVKTASGVMNDSIIIVN